MLDRLAFLLGEAFISLRRNTWMSFAAITTATMALFLLGGMGYAYLAINKYAASLPQRFEMRVFLQEGLTGEQIAETSKEIRSLEGVASLDWLPKDIAWREFRKQFPDLTEQIDNPLPNAFKLRLKSVDQAPEVAAKIETMPAVEKNGVRYLDDERQLISEMLRLVRWLGLVLGGLMLLTSGVLIYNAIRMTIVARRREIRIMSLVGATQATIMIPLLIEGLVQGAIGGLLSAMLLWSAHLGFGKVLEGLSAMARVGAFSVAFWMFWLVAAGAAYGIVCSLAAIRDPRSIR